MIHYLNFQNIALLMFFGGLLTAYISSKSIAKTLRIILYFAPMNILFIGKTGSSVIAMIVIIFSLAILLNSQRIFKRPNVITVFWFLIALILIVSSIPSFPNHFWFLTSWISCSFAAYVLVTDEIFEDFDILSYVSNSSLIISSTSLLFLLPSLGSISSNLGFSYVDEWGFQRLRGTTGDYELTAEILVLGFIATSAIKYKSLSIHVLKLLIITSVLVLTGTRAAFLAPLGVIIYLIGKRQKFHLFRYALLVFMPLVLSVSFLGTTLISRFQFQRSSYLVNKFNRSSVWEHYDNLAIKSEIVGRGPNYPFLDYGFYPHSLTKSLLYIGGWLTLVTFFLILIYLYAKLLINIKRDNSDTTLVSVILLTVFLVDQIKVEFTRTGGYILFVSIFFTLISVNGSKGIMKSGMRK